MVGITKAVGDRFGKGGIADRMIWFNGFPFLDSKEEHTFGVPVSHVMIKEVTALASSGMSLQAVETMLAKNKYQGFPVVEDRAMKFVIGYIGRTELQYAINRAKTEGFLSPDAQCLFTPPSSAAVRTPSAAVASPLTMAATESFSGPQRIDFSRFIDPTPLTVHPRLPLETVMELFKKMGPRVILIDYRGRLAGLVTVKDCLKYQFRVEAHETVRDGAALDERQEKLWAVMRRMADWMADQVSRRSGGRIPMGEPRGSAFLASHVADGRESLLPRPTSASHGILEGTEDDELGTELSDRR